MLRNAAFKGSHAAKYAACVVLASVAAVIVAMPVFGQTTPVTLVGAGDIARCDAGYDEQTAQLIGNTLDSLTNYLKRDRRCWRRYHSRMQATLISPR
jgi:hypothetical protein